MGPIVAKIIILRQRRTSAMNQQELHTDATASLNTNMNMNMKIRNNILPLPSPLQSGFPVGGATFPMMVPLPLMQMMPLLILITPPPAALVMLQMKM